MKTKRRWLRTLFRMLRVAILEWRRDTLPPAPSTARVPSEWVTLLFCCPDREGVFRNHVQHYESEEMAIRGLQNVADDFRAGFRGAFLELPGFLDRVNARDASITGPTKPPELATVGPSDETTRTLEARREELNRTQQE